MSKKLNNLREVLEAKNADTKQLKAQLKALGIPPTTLWNYINNPERDIKGSHVGIIMRVTGCTHDELINGLPKTEESADFNLSK
jgi:hypothetical protein